jgi:hypothetical protein
MVTEYLVWQSTSRSAPTEDGFGFQLNAYSPPGALCAWQQYIIALFGAELTGWAYNWAGNGEMLNTLLQNTVDLTTLPNVTIPAGYSLQISLANDNDGNVVAATYVVTDNLRNTQANVTQDLLVSCERGSFTRAALREYLVGGLGPDEGLAAVVPPVDEGLDGGNEVGGPR